MLDIGADLPVRGRFRALYGEINRIKKALRQLQPISSLNILTGVTGNGTYREGLPTRGGGAAKLNQYRLKEMFGDFYRCRKLDGAVEDTEDVFIAKPWRLRRSTTEGKTIHFDTGDEAAFDAHYSFTTNTKRTVTIGGASEVQIVIPRFKLDFDIIYAIESEDDLGLTDTNLEPITLIDINADGRAWAQA